MKAKPCDECRHAYLQDAEAFVLLCAKGHRPRFYLPKSPLDDSFGWKRVCKDFTKKRLTGCQTQVPSKQ